MSSPFKLSLIALLFFTHGSFSFANENLNIPKRLVHNDAQSFYSAEDICNDKEANFPDKKAALIVVKTHYCDSNSSVCLKTAALVSDPANHFIHDNFVVYHTRFASQRRHIENSGEKMIRSAWGKDDSNPEFYVVDTKKCEIIHREYAKDFYYDGMFYTKENGKFLNFEANYRAARKLLLSNPDVVKLLGDQYTLGDQNQIEAELDLAMQIRKEHPQETLESVLKALAEQDKQLELQYRDSKMVRPWNAAPRGENMTPEQAKKEREGGWLYRLLNN